MSRDNISLISWQRFAGNRRLFSLCLLLFMVSAFFSFWTFFPAEVLQRRLLQEVSRQAGFALQGRNATMLFPLGLGLDLSIYPELSGLSNLDLTGLQITPAWSSLFSDHRQVSLTGTLAGGEINAEVGQGGQFSSRFEDIAVVALQQPTLPYRISGQLAGHLAGENISSSMNGRGNFSLVLQDGRVLGLEKIGLPANFFAGMLQLEGKLDQRRVSLEKVVLTGGSLELSGGGNILVGEIPEQTRLNLNVRLHPTSTTPDSLRELLKLTGIRPTADGSYLLRVGGTLAKPVIR